jgi:uncharacterized protein (TIGR03437 family)
MQVTVKGLSIQRQFPFTVSNLNLFADLTSNEVACPSDIANGFQPVVRNQDGKLNSCSNPAPYGSIVSFFAHGVGADQLGFPPVSQLSNLVAYVGNCAVAVQNARLIGDFVYQVEVPLPSSLLPCAQSYSLTAAENPFPITFSYNGAPVGPFVVPNPSGVIINFEPGQPMPMIVWVTQ